MAMWSENMRIGHYRIVRPLGEEVEVASPLGIPQIGALAAYEERVKETAGSSRVGCRCRWSARRPTTGSWW